jgi:integrase
MSRRVAPVIRDFRVQQIRHTSGSLASTVVDAFGRIDRRVDAFLRTFTGSGTQRTYAYVMVDHLRWLAYESLTPETIAIGDLKRYMGLLGADVPGPLGPVWRVGKRPLSNSSLTTAASCLKGFYSYQGDCGVNTTLASLLSQTRLPTRADRQRRLLGHLDTALPTNPLAPRRHRRRHPKMLPDGSRDLLLASTATARDRLVVTWLLDAGFRIGELCGLHLGDLHLRSDGLCGDSRTAHVHVCHRWNNINGAAAKSKYVWSVQEGLVSGGLVKRVSPAMVHTYFEYMTTEYPAEAAHGMLLVQLSGSRVGHPWTTAGARGMLKRLGSRAGVGPVRPHAFRHTFATAVLEASGGNLVIARDAGGWASAQTVDEIYAHTDINDPAFAAALQKVWGAHQ